MSGLTLNALLRSRWYLFRSGRGTLAAIRRWQAGLRWAVYSQLDNAIGNRPVTVSIDWQAPRRSWLPDADNVQKLCFDAIKGGDDEKIPDDAWFEIGPVTRSVQRDDPQITVTLEWGEAA